MKNKDNQASDSQLLASPPPPPTEQARTSESVSGVDPEEIEMLNDSDFMERFTQAKDDIAKGKTRKWEGVKRNVSG